MTVAPVPERIGRDAELRGSGDDAEPRLPPMDFSGCTGMWQLLGAKTLSFATTAAAVRHANGQGRRSHHLSADGYVLEEGRR